jgi:hypothetical protein
MIMMNDDSNYRRLDGKASSSMFNGTFVGIGPERLHLESLTIQYSVSRRYNRRDHDELILACLRQNVIDLDIGHR